MLAKERYDYMKAISDLNGIDIKHHGNEAKNIVYVTREWFIETVGLRDVDGPLKIWYQYNNFQTKIYESKFLKYYGEYEGSIAEEIAADEIYRMPMAEFIDEIKSFLDLT